MAHDASKVQLGNIPYSSKTIDNHLGDAETFKAGLAVKNNAGALSLTSGNYLGVSVGKSLDGTARTAVCRKGLRVPLRLTAGFTPVNGAQVFLDADTGMAVASGEDAVGVNAIYCSGVLSGVEELSAEEVRCALIDFQGGL